MTDCQIISEEDAKAFITRPAGTTFFTNDTRSEWDKLWGAWPISERELLASIGIQPWVTAR